MSKIKNKFLELQSKNQKALIAYTVVGYPSEKGTLSVVRGFIRGGADIIELGLPFSDPLADGPIIQNAIHLALKNGMTTAKFFDIVKKIRKETDLPLVLMTYTNLLFRQGYEKFISCATKAGIDGFILPDMPIEEAAKYLKSLHKYNADAIFLASPNTSKERFQKIVRASSGFLYLVSIYGTTGTRQKIKRYTINAIKLATKISNGKIPVAVGFGVSDPSQVRNFIKIGADAVIVGTAFLRLIDGLEQKKIESSIAHLTHNLKGPTRLKN